VPGSQRGELIRRFHDDDSQQVFISTDAGATGLNLQVATVLVNLDIPWNPAVMEQRIARIHRLGQRRSVFVVNMVAFEGYEARVLQMAQGKRNLFDNVVDPEAQADVVGVSRQALDSILSSLDPTTVGRVDQSEQAADDGEAAEPAAGDSSHRRDAMATDPQTDPAIAAAIAGLQQHFGDRLERVMGSAGGVLGILSEYRDGDEEAVADIAAKLTVPARAAVQPDAVSAVPAFPLSVIDQRGWRSMQRLGNASPLASATLHYQADAPAAAGPSRLWLGAQEKLAGAETLARAGQGRAAAELLAAVLRAASAVRGGLTQPPASGQIALWLYAEAVPRGWLAADEAAAVLRAEALVQAETIPESLLQQLFDDAGQALRRAQPA
jgi:hypothetical protein